MALKKVGLDQYIKLDLDGTFIIYKTTTERVLEKNAPSFKTISAKYQSIISAMYADTERVYYDPKFKRLISDWETEYARYANTAQRREKGTDFPLMKQYFENIENSLPKIILTGQVGVYNATTLQEVYDQVKHYQYFGEVEDC